MGDLFSSRAAQWANEAVDGVDWGGLHQRSQAAFDHVRNGGSLALASGMVPTPPPAPYQAGDFQRSGPNVRVTGPIEAVKNAFDVHEPWGVGDTINAALWMLPGMRGTIRPRPFTGSPHAANANIASYEVDALTQAILDHPKYGLLARQPAESLSNPFLRRRLANMEARGNQQAKEVAAKLPENARANDLFELLFNRKPPSAAPLDVGK